MSLSIQGPSAVLAELVEQGSRDRTAAADRSDDTRARALLARKLEAIAHEQAGEIAVVAGMAKLARTAENLSSSVEAYQDQDQDKDKVEAPASELTKPSENDARKASENDATNGPPKEPNEWEMTNRAILRRLLAELDQPLSQSPELAAGHAQSFGEAARRAESAAAQARTAEKQARMGIRKLAELADALGRARGGQS